VDTAGIAALGSRHYIVKRVVAVPGDTVGVNNCRLVLNGSIIVEEYVAAESLVGCDSVEDEVTLGSNQYYVLGDNRAASTDSRIFGPVPDWSLVGKVIFEL
jgi:signal peptidase I